MSLKPGGQGNLTGDEQEDELLNAAEARRFRAHAARANYLSMDRDDMQLAAKEVCKDMARPQRSSWLRLKSLGRYLLECPVLGWAGDPSR